MKITCDSEMIRQCEVSRDTDRSFSPVSQKIAAADCARSTGAPYTIATFFKQIHKTIMEW